MVVLEKQVRISKGRCIHPVGTMNVHNFITNHLVDIVIFPFFFFFYKIEVRLM